MPRLPIIANEQAFTYQDDSRSSYEQIDAFRRRQDRDLKRFQPAKPVIRRRPFHERYRDIDQGKHRNTSFLESDNALGRGEEAWRSSEGDRLDDYGVDEDIEFYDEDDIPLAELRLRQRKEPRPQSD